MSTYRQIYYQIVFGTKYRKPTITRDNDLALYSYINGVLKNKKCIPYEINGMEDHIHIMCDIHPTICLSDLVKDIKLASSSWMKEGSLFPAFDQWQEGYGAFTYSIREKQMIMNYIKNQKPHHFKETFYDEFKRLLTEHGIEFDEKYLL